MVTIPWMSTPSSTFSLGVTTLPSTFPLASRSTSSVAVIFPIRVPPTPLLRAVSSSSRATPPRSQVPSRGHRSPPSLSGLVWMSNEAAVYTWAASAMNRPMVEDPT